MNNAIEARRAVRQSLLDNGIPAAAVDEVTDLAFHAAETAHEAFKNVILRGSDPRIMITAIGVGAGVLSSLIGQMQAATQTFAQGEGLPVKHVMVRVGQ